MAIRQGGARVGARRAALWIVIDTLVVVYALLAFSAAWLPLPGRYRVCLLFFLMAHATVTELLQELLEEYCHRGGKLSDVVFDQFGILFGMLLSWNWWSGYSFSARPTLHARIT